MVNFKARVVSALGWAVGVKFGGQLVNWVITIFVIRLLEPRDYGLMALAMMFVYFLTLMNELGLGATVIQKRELTKHQLQQIFGLILLVNGGLCLLLVFSAPLISIFFEEQKLTLILRVLSLHFVFVSFGVIPHSLLQRDLDFKRKSIIDMIGNLVGGVTTLILATLGYGVWALVFGSLVIVATVSIMANAISSPVPRPSFSFHGMRTITTFGTYITLERVFWYLYVKADIFIIGKLLGKELLGIYSVAKEFAFLPAQKISPVLNLVAFPSYSYIQDDVLRTSKYTLKAIYYVSLIAFPLFFGLSLTASEFIPVILGQQWERSILPVSVISLVLPLSMVSGILQAGIKGVGHPRITLRNMVFAFLLMSSSFLVASRFGLTGMSYAWLIAYPVFFFIMVSKSAKFLHLGVSSIVKTMAYPFISSSIMYLVTLTIKLVFGDYMLHLHLLIVLIVCGSVSYGILFFFTQRKNYQELVRLVKVSS